MIGGRVKSLARLLALEEFATVQLQLVKEIIKEFEGDPMLADIAKQQEAERFQEEVRAAAPCCSERACQLGLRRAPHRPAWLRRLAHLSALRNCRN